MNFISFDNSLGESLGAVPKSSTSNTSSNSSTTFTSPFRNYSTPADKPKDDTSNPSESNWDMMNDTDPSMLSAATYIFIRSMLGVGKDQKTSMYVNDYKDKNGEISWRKFLRLNKDEQKQYFVQFPNSVHLKRFKNYKTGIVITFGVVTLGVIGGIVYLASPKNEVENDTPKKTKAIKG